MPHPSRYWWTLAVLAALVWTGLTPPAARAQARTIDYRGWTVQLTQDLPIRSIAAGDVTLLKDFRWNGQTNRDGKVAHLASQGSAKLEVHARTEDGVQVFETEPVTLDCGLEWSVRLRFTEDAIEYEYRFHFRKAVPKSWFYIAAEVPDNSGWQIHDLAGDRRAVVYQTPAGELTFESDNGDSLISPHRPMLDRGYRLHVGKGEKGAPQRDFTAGQQFVIHGRIVPPGSPGSAGASANETSEAAKTSGAELPGAGVGILPAGLATASDAPFWLFTPGQMMRVTVPVEVKSTAQPAVRMRWELSDLYGRTVWRSSESIDLRKLGGQVTAEIPAPERFGPYRLTLAFERVLPGGQTEVMQKDVAVLGVRDPRWAEARIPADQSQLGAVIHGGKDLHEFARAFGFRWKRLMFETMWNWNSPAEGEYHFDPEMVRWERSIGIEGLGNFVYSPGWAVDATDAERQRVASERKHVHDLFSNRPPHLDAFRQYVREAATTFKDDVQFWELWNEPNGPLFWKGTPEQYAELLRISREVLAEVNPTAKLVAPAQGGGPEVSPWSQAVIDAGGLKDIDIWSTHSYVDSPTFDAEQMHRRIQKLKATLAASGRPDMPIWWTEGGMGGTTSMFRDGEFAGWPDPAQRPQLDPRKAFTFPKLFTVQRAEGVQRHFFYFIKPNAANYASYVSSEPTGAARFPLFAIGAWSRFIDGGTFAERLTQSGLGFAYLFDRPDAAAAMIWADLPDNETADLPVSGAGIEAYDGFGNRIDFDGSLAISLAPVYLLWPGRTAADLRRAIDWDALPRLSNPALIAERHRGAELNLPNISDFAIANELGREHLAPLDLRPYANMGFVDPVMGDGKGGWSDEGPFNDLHGVEVGVHAFHGVPIELIDPATNRGAAVVSLKSAKFPQGSDGFTIPLGRKPRGVFVMHTVQNYPKPGVMYQLVFHYANGQNSVVPMSYPNEVGSSWSPPNVIDEEAHHTKAVYLPVSADQRTMLPATRQWVEQTNSPIIYRFPRITYVENPNPDAGEVASLEIRSANPAGGVPIILGITAPK